MPSATQGLNPGATDPGSDNDVTAWPTGRLLSTAARIAERRWGAELAVHGLSHAGLAALAHLQAGPLTQHQVAELTHVEDQTMSRTLDRLQRQGHVARAQDPGDRRRRMVSLTPGGRDALLAVLRSGADRRIVDETVSAATDLGAFRAGLVALVLAEESVTTESLTESLTECSPRDPGAST